MKKPITLLLIITCQFLIINCFAQSPEKMNYQGVARDNTGNILANTGISLRLTVRSGSVSGTIVYRETHSVTTNVLGLFNVQIGGGTVVSGTVAGIDWSANTYYVETELDPAGGSSYTSLGALQLVSVPYSLYSKKAGNVSGTTNYIPKFTPSGTILGNSRVFDDGYYIGIGTSFPVWDLQLNNQSPSQTMFHITNSSTGGAEGDGLLLGLVSGTGDAVLMNGETGKYLALGTAGLERMRIDPYGYVGIGTTSPQWQLQVNSQGVESVLQLSATSSTGSGDLDGLLLGINSTRGNLTNMENTGLFLGNASTGGINISSSGNIGIGTATPAQHLHQYGSGSDEVVRVQNSSSTFSSVELVRGGTSWKLSAGPNSGDFNIISSTDGFVTPANRFQFWTNYFIPTTDNSVQFGGSANRWSTIYAGNGVINTSDAREKSNISNLNYGIADVMKLRPVSFTWKEHPKWGTKLGLIAQEVKEVVGEVVVHGNVEPIVKENGEIIPHVDKYGIYYSDLIPVLIKAIQEQQQIIENQGARIKALEAK